MVQNTEKMVKSQVSSWGDSRISQIWGLWVTMTKLWGLWVTKTWVFGWQMVKWGVIGWERPQIAGSFWSHMVRNLILSARPPCPPPRVSSQALRPKVGWGACFKSSFKIALPPPPEGCQREILGTEKRGKRRKKGEKEEKKEKEKKRKREGEGKYLKIWEREGWERR